MSIKKDFTKSDNAINKFFNVVREEKTDADIVRQIASDSTSIAIITKDIKHSDVTKHTHVSKYYDKRGKREERLGLLVDKRLKDDLKMLSNMSGNGSLNDFIVCILIEFTENSVNQAKLVEFREFVSRQC